MLDLSVISDAEKIAKGEFSIVRAQHEDEKKSLQMLCGKLSSVAALVLRKMQPDNDEIPESVDGLIEVAQNTLQMMAACAAQIESLAKQRAELKQKAWCK